jgi:hypothetical protein
MVELQNGEKGDREKVGFREENGKWIASSARRRKAAGSI